MSYRAEKRRVRGDLLCEVAAMAQMAENGDGQGRPDAPSRGITDKSARVYART